MAKDKRRYYYAERRKISFDNMVGIERAIARERFDAIYSYHEGIALIEEEFLELRAEVFTKEVDCEAVLLELVQLAGLCKAFAEDLLQVGGQAVSL